MARKAAKFPPFSDLKDLGKALRAFNAEHNAYIERVLVRTSGKDKGNNVVVFDDEKKKLPAPTLKEFPSGLTKQKLADEIEAIEREGKLVFRTGGPKRGGAGKVLFEGNETKWVVLFDKVPVSDVSVTPGKIGTISQAHWLSSARKDHIPQKEKQLITPRYVVIHFTQGFGAEGSIETWKKSQKRRSTVEAHVVVERDGRIIQCRPFNQKCNHAGTSRTVNPESGDLDKSLNFKSIGIEIANTGDGGKPGPNHLHKRLSRHVPGAKLLKKQHRNVGQSGVAAKKRMTHWEKYPEAQLETVFALVALLKEKYPIVDITGHDCIAPERKADPGPAFPMADLRKANGLKSLPGVFASSGKKLPV